MDAERSGAEYLDCSRVGATVAVDVRGAEAVRVGFKTIFGTGTNALEVKKLTRRGLEDFDTPVTLALNGGGASDQELIDDDQLDGVEELLVRNPAQQSGVLVEVVWTVKLRDAVITTAALSGSPPDVLGGDAPADLFGGSPAD